MTASKLPRLLSLALVLGLGPVGCGDLIPDTIDLGADDDEDEDEDEAETDDGDDTGPTPIGDDGDDDSDGNDTFPPQDTGDNGDDKPDPTGDGPGPVDPPHGGACAAYCDVELACDEYFESADECVAACDGELQNAGECAPAFDQMNLCLGTLNCDEFATFWAALSDLYQGGETDAFPCADEFLAVYNCGAE